MSNVSIDDLCKKIVSLSTPRKQKLKVMEELSELIRAVSRYISDPSNEDNINNVFEEMSDVYIVMRELELLLIHDLGVDKFTDYAVKWEDIKYSELEELIETLKTNQ